MNKRKKLPPWIRVKIAPGSARDDVSKLLEDLELNTVCKSALCPNLDECWHKKTATFMILGDSCTRNCKFCAVPHNTQPPLPDKNEPSKIAEATKKLNLKYVVITSVTRDDLPDGGASHFASVICEVRKTSPNIQIEVLTPDFNNDINALQQIIEAKPTVFNHNIETVERLSCEIRSKATYRKSLEVLKNANVLGQGKIPIKSGIMVGLGENYDEIIKTICEIRKVGVNILTIGQYLQPRSENPAVFKYWEPKYFQEWKDYALEIGFSSVASSPLVRSSYNAYELMDNSIGEL